MKEPKTVKDALEDVDWSKPMEEEIEKIETNKTWSLVPRREDENVIGTKCDYKKKLDRNGEVTRNKARLVCEGYAQEEGIDYVEIFSSIARLEGVRALFSYFAYKDFKVYHMDVKSTFLNGILEEEVYIEKPEEFLMLTTRMWYVDYTLLYMVWRKHEEHGMRDFIMIL